MPGSSAHTLPLPPATKLIASGLAGDRRSLERLAAYPKLSGQVAAHGAGPALALRAERIGVEGSCVAGWQEARQSRVVVGGWQQAGLQRVAEALGKAGVRWAPFLGSGLGGDILPAAEDCASTGLDILIPGDELDRARRALRAGGWRPEDEHPASERFLAEEGFQWRARDDRGLTLQLYHRLWGCLPPSLGSDMLIRARPDGILGVTGHRLAHHDCYVLSAVNAWLAPRPRSVLLWWELQRLVESSEKTLATEILRETKLTGLHFFVGLAAAVVDGLWEHRCNREVARLLGDLPRAESVLLAFLRRANLEKVRPGLLILARQLAGRRSRLGWRSLTRTVWGHPAMVERTTPEDWKWFKRRAWHVANSIGLMPKSKG